LRRGRRGGEVCGRSGVPERPRCGPAAPCQLPELLGRRESRQSQPPGPHGLLGARHLPVDPSGVRAGDRADLPVPNGGRSGRVALIGRSLLGPRGLLQRLEPGHADVARPGLPERPPPLRARHLAPGPTDRFLSRNSAAACECRYTTSMDQTQFPWRPLGALLAERGLLTEAELEDALDEQQRSGRLLCEILVGRGNLTGWTLTRVLTVQHGVELLSTGGAEERPAKDEVAQPPQAKPTSAGSGTAWPPLGRLLVETGFLGEAELKEALAEQGRDGRRLGEVLVSRGSLSGDALARALAAQHGVELESTDELEATIKPSHPGVPVY